MPDNLFSLALLLLVAAAVAYFAYRDYRLRHPADALPAAVPAPATDWGKRLRKAAPYLLLPAFGLLAIYGPRLFPGLVAALYDATAAPGPAASSAEIAAGQQGGGWVPSGTVASKFITAAGALVLMVVLIWRLQNLTHPEPSRWAKEDYTAAWQQLSTAEKFEAYGRVRLQYVILAAAALVFAALVV